MKWKSLFWWIYTAVQLFWATILLKTCRGLIVNVQHVSIICYCLLKYHDDDILLADYETKMLMKIQVITIITAILLLQCVWLPFKIITDKLNNKILQCFFLIIIAQVQRYPKSWMEKMDNENGLVLFQEFQPENSTIAANSPLRFEQCLSVWVHLSSTYCWNFVPLLVVAFPLMKQMLIDFVHVCCLGYKSYEICKVKFCQNTSSERDRFLFL